MSLIDRPIPPASVSFVKSFQQELLWLALEDGLGTHRGDRIALPKGFDKLRDVILLVLDTDDPNFDVGFRLDREVVRATFSGVHPAIPDGATISHYYSFADANEVRATALVRKAGADTRVPDTYFASKGHSIPEPQLRESPYYVTTLSLRLRLVSILPIETTELHL
jgi:hypothetical protein